MANDGLLRILIVDDNPDDVVLLQRLVDRGLETVPHEIYTANTMLAAVHLLQTVEIDLVLLDLSLPAESYGLDTVKRVDAAAPHTPIVVVSAEPDLSVLEQAVEAGAQGYVPKGQLDQPRLVAAMYKAIEQRQRFKSLLDRIQPSTPPPAGSDHGG